MEGLDEDLAMLDQDQEELNRVLKEFQPPPSSEEPSYSFRVERRLRLGDEDGNIENAIDDVINSRKKWLVLHIKDNTLQIKQTGKSGLSNFAYEQELSEDEVIFIYFRFFVPDRNSGSSKFILFSWCGKSVEDTLREQLKNAENIILANYPKMTFNKRITLSDPDQLHANYIQTLQNEEAKIAISDSFFETFEQLKEEEDMNYISAVIDRGLQIEYHGNTDNIGSLQTSLDLSECKLIFYRTAKVVNTNSQSSSQPISPSASPSKKNVGRLSPQVVLVIWIPSEKTAGESEFISLVNPEYLQSALGIQHVIIVRTPENLSDEYVAAECNKKLPEAEPDVMDIDQRASPPPKAKEVKKTPPKKEKPAKKTPQPKKAKKSKDIPSQSKSGKSEKEKDNDFINDDNSSSSLSSSDDSTSRKRPASKPEKESKPKKSKNESDSDEDDVDAKTLKKGSIIAVRGENEDGKQDIFVGEFVKLAKTSVHLRWYGQIKDLPWSFVRLEWYDKVQASAVMMKDIKLEKDTEKGVFLLSDADVAELKKKL